LLLVLAVMALAAPGAADAATITEFSAGITPGAGPRGIAAGPDGNLWFADVDRVTKRQHVVHRGTWSSGGNGSRSARGLPPPTLRDFRRRRTIVVRAGKRYLARAPR
jgi:hypothetical protein